MHDTDDTRPPVWASLSPEEHEFQYNPQRAFPDFAESGRLREAANRHALSVLRCERDLAYGEHPLRRLDAAHRERRHDLGRVAVQKIVDTVAAGVHPGYEVRPGHRGQGRDRGLQRLEAAPGGQAAEVGHPALCHQPGGHGVVHAVDPQHKHPCRAAAVLRPRGPFTAPRQGQDQKQRRAAAR